MFSRQSLIEQVQTPKVPQHLKDTEGLEITHQFFSAFRNKDLKKIRQSLRGELLQYYLTFVSDVMTERVNTSQPFAERLVAFWGNHFTVSIEKPTTLGLLRDYEFTAIRPHINGKFEDMLIAVAQHPAMLAYLDNWLSFGPNTMLARFSKRGLNENLGREILELHTLGVDGGYTQADVIALSKMLTGWSIERRNRKPYPKFKFHSRGHEPGSKTLLGKTYQEDGINEAISAFKMLAVHPKTARRLATKMAVHFVSDKPPESLIKKMEKAYLRSGGHLGEMTLAMVNAQESWAQPLSKIKTTPDYVVSTFKVLGFEPKPVHFTTSLDSMDYRPYKAPDPQGFSDENEYWAAPGAVLKRVQWAQEVVERIEESINPYDFGRALFGSVMSGETAFALKGAESQAQGLTLLFMSPEFQRR